jgi:flagella basal body P-ring formation protein FlgA
MIKPATRGISISARISARISGRISGLVVLCLLGTPVFGAAAKSLETLLGEAERLLEAEAREEYPDARVEARMQSLDPRLDLPPCETAELTPRGQQRHGRIPVAVRCLTPQPWSVFLTGDVAVSVPVVITTRPIRRGETFDASMLTLADQDLTQLRSLFYTDPAVVVGKEARRNLPASAVVVVSQLTEPVAVERGNKVQIVARRGSVEITSAGEALSDGRLGAQVRVRNLNSGRIVHAWVESPGRVSTTPGHGT